jgi:hypothetical protein
MQVLPLGRAQVAAFAERTAIGVYDAISTCIPNIINPTMLTPDLGLGSFTADVVISRADQCPFYSASDVINLRRRSDAKGQKRK